MKTHELKTWPKPFQAIADGTKRFEWRQDDREYQVGDFLYLREWDPDASEYTGRSWTAEVTYLLREGFGIPPGFVVMSISTGAEHHGGKS